MPTPRTGPRNSASLPSLRRPPDTGRRRTIKVLRSRPRRLGPEQRPGNEVAYIAPTELAGRGESPHSRADPLRHWRETEAQTRRDNPGYERVRMDETHVRGQRAGYWAFTFKARVRDFRAAELAFTGADGTKYVVYLYAPSAQRDEFRPRLRRRRERDPAAGVAVLEGAGVAHGPSHAPPRPSPAQRQVSDRPRAMRAPASKSS